jgi:uncharacterized glyoxalase superfamily protein PhnB
VDEHPAIAVQTFYADVKRAADWLQRVFGFTESWHLDGPDGALLMATLNTPGGGSVMVSTLGDDEAVPSKPNPYYSITVVVPDVDAHAAAARAAGADLVTEPTDQPWGFRDYEVLDHDGRQWNFSQVLHAVVPEDWGATSDPS